MGKSQATPELSREGWIERMAGLSPPQLAAWLRQWRGGLGAPSRLTVQVGLAERWCQPGLLLLGDAAHPMGPVRAQGINMALRDAWVAAMRLLPLLSSGCSGAALDGVAVQIEAERRPEIISMQTLQAAEAARGERSPHPLWAPRSLPTGASSNSRCARD